MKANTGKLPAALPLIGREQAIAEVEDALSETRLLTIVGAAGVGKSSLAITLASRSADRFKDGVCCVELSTIDDPQAVADPVSLDS